MFRPYPKIAEKLSPDAKLSGAWTASEKVHGANLALVSDSSGIYAARRKSIMQPEEYGSFFGLINIWPQLKLCAQSLSQEIGEPFIIYGELAGGLYADEPISPKIAPVQGGIHYSPNLVYLVFDLYLSDSDLWISDTKMRELMQKHGFMTTPLIARGSYQKLMQLPVRFSTHVPRMLELPHLAQNFAEGLILKPDRDLRTSERNIVKLKRAAFREKLPKGQTRKLLKGHESWLVFEAAMRLAPARVWSARSKVQERDLGNEIIDDIIAEIEEEFGEISPSDLEVVKDYLASSVDELIRQA